MAVRDYPWAALEPVKRRVVSGQRAARESWARAFSPGKLGAALAELTGAGIEVRVLGFGGGRPAERLVEQTLEAGSVRVTVGAEPALVLELVERVLGRPFSLKHTGLALEPPLAGAFAALVLEAARRVASEPLVLGAQRVDADSALGVHTVVHVEGRPYAAYALVGGEPAPTRASESVRVESLGALRLSVPLVIGLSLVTPAELRKLKLGWAFVPGEGLFIDQSAHGFGVLAAAGSERGVRVDLGPASGIVLRDEILVLAPDIDCSGDSMDEANDLNQTLTDAVLEAPVVVRIELGAVSMTAADWARLRPGDVIETGQRLAEPVTLRIGGRVVARGELVDVEGELGVRVRELAGMSDP